MLKKMSFLILYFLSPIIPIAVIYNSTPQKYENINFLLSMMLGAACYTWLTAEFVLIARPKFIEKYFGLDKFYRFHALMAIISVFLVFLHKTIQEDIWGEIFTAEVGEKAWLIYIGIIVMSLLFMVDSVLLKIKPFSNFKKVMQKVKFTKYEYQVAIHNISVIALVLMFIHVMLTYGAKGNLSIKLVYIVYFAIGAGFYIYHKIIKHLILRNNIFEIENVKKESSNMWTLVLTSTKKKVLKYKPGQFGFVRIFGSGIKMEEHPFSISSAPSKHYSLSITIKELGDFTSNIKNIKPGYKAYFDGPYGNFSYLDHPNEKETVLIVGGVGITPALSMLRHMCSYDTKRSVILLWGANNQDELICVDEINEMKKKLSKFLLVPILFKDDSRHGEKGIIDLEKIQRIIKDHGCNINNTGFYVCGPKLMLDNVLKSLKTLGIKKNKIHFEKFSL